MRRVPIVGVFIVAVIASGCSTVSGSPSSKPSRAPACAFIAKLDAIADSVAHADVHDPDAFNTTFKSAVRDYVANVRQLRAVAPADLSAGLEQVEADVQQYRFDAALTDRAQLDAYAARTCGRVTRAATTSSAPAASTTAPVSSTIAPTGPTTTTTPSDG